MNIKKALTVAAAAVSLLANGDDAVKSEFWRVYSMGYRLANSGNFTSSDSAVQFVDGDGQNAYGTNQTVTCTANQPKGYMLAKWFWADSEVQFDAVRKGYRELSAFAGQSEIEINYSMFNKDTVYLAVSYSNIVYGIKYVYGSDSSGGMVAVSKAKYSASVKLPKNVETRAGYKFAGWALSYGGDVAFADGATVTGSNFSALDDVHDGNGMVSLYAVWLENEFTIATGHTRFGSGSVTPATGVFEKGNVVQLSASPAVGNSFEGWTDGVTASKRLVMVASNAAYTAKFKPVSYEISLNPGADASVRPTHKRVTFGSGYGKLPTPVLDGRDFSHWATKPDGAGAAIVSSTIVTSAVPHSLYAVWKPTYVVHFMYYDANAEFKTNHVSVTSGCDATPPDHATVNQYPGHAFEGWNGSYENVTSERWVTARYRANQYIVYLHSNLTPDTITTQLFTYGESKALANPHYINPGHKMLGWDTDKQATIAKYANEEVVKDLTTDDGGRVDFYSVWGKADDFMVAFVYRNNNGVLASNVCSVAYGKAAASVPTAEQCDRWVGHAFIGWDTSAYTYVTENLTVNARYNEGATYVMRFDPNGGEGAMADLSVTLHGEANLPTNAFAKSGNMFVGWATNAADKAIYRDGEKKVGFPAATADQVVALYAQWEALTDLSSALNCNNLNWKNVKGSPAWTADTDCVTGGDSATMRADIISACDGSYELSFEFLRDGSVVEVYLNGDMQWDSTVEKKSGWRETAITVSVKCGDYIEIKSSYGASSLRNLTWIMLQ